MHRELLQRHWSVNVRSAASLTAAAGNPRKARPLRAKGPLALFICSTYIVNVTNASGAQKGRGAGLNPTNRFERISFERDIDWDPGDDRPLRTEFYRDTTQSVINFNDSPDVGFEASLNPYRGCEHGCVYCFARPTHEYLGFSAGLDFESRIMVKERAPELLRKELSSPKWKPQVLVMSGVTDCYQPIERKLQITRRVLQVLAEFRNPVGIITKNFLVTRDIDVMQELAKYNCIAVNVSVTPLTG